MEVRDGRREGGLVWPGQYEASLTRLRLESMVAKASATVLRSTPAMTRDPHSQSSLMLSVPFYRISGLSMELGAILEAP